MNESDPLYPKPDYETPLDSPQSRERTATYTSHAFSDENTPILLQCSVETTDIPPILLYVKACGCPSWARHSFPY